VKERVAEGARLAVASGHRLVARRAEPREDQIDERGIVDRVHAERIPRLIGHARSGQRDGVMAGVLRRRGAAQPRVRQVPRGKRITRSVGRRR
jgi:hypothetical protein